MSNILHQSQWFSIRVGVNGDEYVASTGDEVLVVPFLDTGEVILTREPSAAFGEPTLILPGGETGLGVTQAETANLELQEELGFRSSHLDFLGELRPFSKYLAVRSFIYLARDLSESKLVGDEAYEIGIERIPLDSFESLIISHRLLDARVIAALFLARSFIRNSDSTSTLSSHAEASS